MIISIFLNDQSSKPIKVACLSITRIWLCKNLNWTYKSRYDDES